MDNLDEKLKLIQERYGNDLEAFFRDAIAGIKAPRPMKGMMKKRFELNECVSFGPILNLNNGAQTIGMTVSDNEAETWQRFDFKREQIAQLVEWLNDWLRKTA